MSRVDRDKVVLFNDKELWGSLIDFSGQATCPKYNPCFTEQRELYASRNELEDFLIDLLAETIDKKMESWIKKTPAERGLR